MTASAQLLTQTRFTLLSFRRNPAATFFTIVFPLIFLLLFTSIFGNNTIEPSGVRVANFYVPGILTLSVIGATFQNLALIMVSLRESNILKRVRGTPLRSWVYISSHVVASALLSVVMTVLVVGIGWLVFDVRLYGGGLPALAITLLLAAGTFCSLGFALSSFIPSDKAASAVVQIIALPLFFISDIFIPPGTDTPRAIEFVGNLFPVKHTSNALFESFNPFGTGIPMPWGHWAVIAGWGVVGLYVALTRFRWS